jgi:lysophospholipid acyltransferase (LPLAT)-like uncharacterized protein
MPLRKNNSAAKALDLKTRLLVNVGAWLVHIWFSTCRVKVVGRKYMKRYFIDNDPAVGATWHRGAIFLVWFFGRYHPIVMFSRSADGELLAGFAAKMGITPVRGSSSRGGREALTTMARFLAKRKRGVAATVLDGPQGPRFVAKAGMVVLAKLTRAPLLPVMMSAWPAITIKSAWDRTLIPLPFARVTVSLQKPWAVPADCGLEGIEALRAEVETKLNQMMLNADTDTGYLKKWPEIYGSASDPRGRQQHPQSARDSIQTRRCKP